MSGEAREAFTRVPLAGVNVLLLTDDAEQTVETDERGRYRFTGIAPGQAEIVFADTTHAKKREHVTITEGTDTRMVVYLRRAQSNELDTVVLGVRDKTQVTTVTLTRQELERSPGSWGDPIRATQNLPGVARAPLFLGALNMRGTLARDSQVFVDGVPLPALYHLSIGPSVIPDAMAEEIVFAPGTFGAQYGRSSAGVVDLRLRPPSTDRFSGKVSVDLMTAQVFVNVPITDKIALSAGIRRSYLDAVLAPILSTTSNVLPIPNFADYHVALRASPSNLGNFDLLVFGSYDAFSFIGTGLSTLPPPHWMFHAVRPSWELHTGKVSNKLTGIGVYVDNGIGSNRPTTADPGSRTQQWQGFLRDDLRINLSDSAELLAGIDGGIVQDQVNSAGFKLSLPNPDDPLSELNQIFYGLIRQAAPNTQLGSFALYTGLDAKLGALRILPSLRSEVFVYDTQTMLALQPRITATLTVHPNVRLQASSGVYQKPPAIQLLSFLQDTTSFGAPLSVDMLGKAPWARPIPLISSWQSSVSAEWQITQALSARLTGYFNVLWDDVIQPAFGGTDAPYVRANGRIYGGEVFVRHRPYKNLFAWLSYSLSRSERLENGTWVLSQVDQTHTLTALASYVFPFGIQIGARFRLSSGAPYSPVLRGVYEGVLDPQTHVPMYAPIDGPVARTARLPMYHQLDVRIDKSWTFDLFRLTAYVDIMNVYMNRVPSGISYSADYSQSKLTTLFFPILPLLGVQAEF